MSKVFDKLKELKDTLELIQTEQKESPLEIPQKFSMNGSLKEQSFMRGVGVVCRHCQALNSHNHSYFSVMDGISSPEAMVDMSAMRGFGGMGISDHGTMGGVLRAGKAGKEWKIGRFKVSGEIFNYRVVDVNKYVDKYVPTGPDFSRLKNEGLVTTILSHLPKAWVEKHPGDKKKVRLVARDERVFRKDEGDIFMEVDLTKHVIGEGGTICDNDWRSMDLSEVRPFLDKFKGVPIIHDQNNPELFRVLNKDEFESVPQGEPSKDGKVQGKPFKVVSGCELYVSWRDKKDAKYHHVTVYATGQKGHRALVLLTSIGSVPSRRFIGNRGFFRPRVFVEDIEKAVAVAGGELVVTTGCPISITSDALRRGNEAEARAFFEWGTRVLPKGCFFAELHLCDVSADWNSRYAMAEDKYYAAAYNVPVSRFRFEDLAEASEHARLFMRDARIFVLGSSLKGFKARQDALTREAPLAEENFDISTEEGMALARKYQNTGIVHPLIEAGISLDVRQVLGKDNFELIQPLSEDIISSAEDLLEAANVAENELAEESEKEVEQVDLLPGRKKKSSKKKSAVKKTSFMTTVKIGGGRTAQLMDEDSLALVAASLKVIDLTKNSSSKVNKPALAAASMVAKMALFVITRIAKEDSAMHARPLDVLKTILACPSSYGIGDKGDGEILLEISSDRLLMLDLPISGDLDAEIWFAAARSLTELLKTDSFLESPLSPKAGPEDGIEKEWSTHPEGNWMDKVTKGLVSLSSEFDVPLLMATDSHMTSPDLKPVQDAIMKRGKRRAWHMSRPYAVPRSDLVGLVEDLGADWDRENNKTSQAKNCAVSMLTSGILSVEDIIESLGSGSLLLEDVKPVGEFKWATAVPKIEYPKHPYYAEAKAFLENGNLKEFLSASGEMTNGAVVLTDKSEDLATAIVVITFIKAIEVGLIPDDPAYYKRIFEEIELQQEVPNEKLADFFIIIQTMITRWRAKGVSVGPGRGSSGGMLTAMVSEITYGDPIKKKFLASRWMNKGRKAKGAHADIDIDVSDRQVAGYELALLAKEAFETSIAERPLDELEKILHAELFYSSVPMAYEVISGKIVERVVSKKDVASGFAASMGVKSHKSMDELKAPGREDKEEEAGDSDSVAELDEVEDGITVIGSPTTRVGTYGSLKAKAAVKEAIRIADKTPFDELPSFAEPPQNWLVANKNIVASQDEKRKNVTDDEKKNRVYEDQKFGHLPLKEREARRRVKLGDRITKEMSSNSGLARLYQGDHSEFDYFMGSVYGVIPEYWDMNMRSPSGSPEASRYFDSNPDVKKLVLDMLNIYKSQGVHAGGFCIGREVFERVPVRADKYGYVAQYGMKDIEAVGILKFDVLGLETLNQISQSLKFIVDEIPYENISWWCPRDIYDRVRSGESTDILWRHIPPSTAEAIDVMCGARTGTFQIDTKVFGKELDKIDPEKVKAIVAAAGDFRDPKNDKLTDIYNAFLALFRPGPMKLNSHVEYIKRLMGEPWTVIHPWLEPFVRDTFGLIVYQEQVMLIWQYGAIQFDEQNNVPKLDQNGKFVIESDELTDEVRRGLGKKDVKALLDMKAEFKFQRGMKAQGVPEEIAKQIWDTIAPFAEYGFNCIPGDELVMTDSGPVSMYELVKGSKPHKVATRTNEGQINFEFPDFKISKGFKEVLKVTLEDGKIIRATPDHQFLSNGEWRTLAEIIEFGLDIDIVNSKGRTR